MSDHKYLATCPSCGRTVMTCWHRYSLHGVTVDSSERCFMSERRVPITGTSEQNFLARANLVAELAAQVQDQDPHEVWEYLTCLPAVELQRLLQVALAAIPVDRNISDVYDWVLRLPAAREVMA